MAEPPKTPARARELRSAQVAKTSASVEALLPNSLNLPLEQINAAFIERSLHSWFHWCSSGRS